VVLGNSFYFALLLPVILILLVNFVVLILVMRSLTASKGSLMAGKKQSVKRQVKIAFACSILLGLTWIFALLAIGDLRYTFQLLFTIFNSLQGGFIFVFYTFMNKDVRSAWKSIFNADN